MVVSVDQAVDMALENPQSQVVFLAVGFETTAPATALAVKRARQEGMKNFSVLTAHKLVLPALQALLDAGNVPIDGFLCPGHVSVILGYGAYEPIAHKYGVPCVVAGFEAAQVMAGVAGILEQVVAGKAESVTVYPAVHAEGNAAAWPFWTRSSSRSDAPWRAIGVHPRQRHGPARRNSPPSTPPSGSNCRRWRATNCPAAAAARSSPAAASRWSVPCSPSAARRAIRWGRAWFPPKGPVRPPINTSGDGTDRVPCFPAFQGSMMCDNLR